MQNSTLIKLHWDLLLKEISQMCQSLGAREKTDSLVPDLTKEKIEQRWAAVDPLKDLINIGYRAPIGDLMPVSGVLRAATLGQQLDGMELRLVFQLLDAVKRVYKFIADFSDRCRTLERARGQIYALPQLMTAIANAVDEEGKLYDDASPELKRIREQKRSMRVKIEGKIQSLLHGSDYEQYLQDDFFTYRKERYVVPIRLDGRGRVKGSIQDTSASGQTLYIEPHEIAPMNEQLQELELAEKLEIIRIFKELTRQVAQNSEIIDRNYEELIELDFYSAQAEFANKIKAKTVKLSETPKLNLIQARHPLIKREDGKGAIANDIRIVGESKVLIISGPNAGGKTVVLETTGLLHLMAKAGLLIPADDESEIYLFDRIFVEMGDSQNLTANLSTFSGHLHGLKFILDRSNSSDLVLLDEIAVGTEPTTGAAIAQAILEQIAEKQIFSITTTHFDALKGMAIEDVRFKNGSMEYSIKDFKPTYKLILDVPGQSYGLEVAEQLGLDKNIVERAKVLKGSSASILDKAVSQLMVERDKARDTQQSLEAELLRVKSEKFRWEQEVQELKESRHKASEKLASKYEDILTKLKEKYQDAMDELKKVKKTLEDKAIVATDVISGEKEKVEGVLSEFQLQLNDLNKDFQKERELPGKVVRFGEVKKGDLVYLINMNKTGTVLKEARSPSDPYEVDMSGLKMRVYFGDLRLMPKKGGYPRLKNVIVSPQDKSNPSADKNIKLDEEKLVLQTQRNTVDLRGFNKDDALDRMWQFIDQALLRGEFGLVVVHGHGTDVVKNAVRDGLQFNSPYGLKFRPGGEREGGDGVTIVMLDH